MARKGAVRIGAHRARLHRDAGELAGMLDHVGHGAFGHVDHNRAQRLRAFRGALDVAAHGHVGHAEQVAQTAHDTRVVCHRLVGDDRHAGAIAHEDVAVAVEDAPARRTQRHFGGTVRVGLVGVVSSRNDLHAPKAQQQHAKGGACQSRKDRRAPAKPCLAGDVERLRRPDGRPPRVEIKTAGAREGRGGMAGPVAHDKKNGNAHNRQHGDDDHNED